MGLVVVVGFVVNERCGDSETIRRVLVFGLSRRQDRERGIAEFGGSGG